MSDKVQENLNKHKSLSSYDGFPSHVDLAPARKLLQTYSGVPADQVDAHIRTIVRKTQSTSNLTSITKLTNLASP